MRVSLINSGRSFSVDPDQSVLDAALQSGLRVPHSCRGGNCGACRARLLRGEVQHVNGMPLGLSDLEAADGYILLCQSRARSDLELDLTELSSADEAVVKRLPSRIERVMAPSHDVLQLFLRLPAAEVFEFAPGQYVDIMLSGGRRRSFSIASPPHDSRFLELHVRRVSGGEFTDPLFAGDPRNTLLTIEGPLGAFVYRAESTAPMLLVGGGTGLAPLKSIVRHVLETGVKRDIMLYWGVRSERDLYAHSELSDWSRRASNFRYQPVLSEPDPGWSGARGWVHEAVLRDFADFERFEVYASGPPSMIAAVRRQFGERGAAPARMFFDSFDYAPDSLERQRKTAATKS